MADTNDTVLAAMALNFTVELALNPMPLSVTTVPAAPLVGVKPKIDSVGMKLVELAPGPTAVVTEIFPAISEFGTIARILVAEMIVYWAG